MTMNGILAQAALQALANGGDPEQVSNTYSHLHNVFNQEAGECTDAEKAWVEEHVGQYAEVFVKGIWVRIEGLNEHTGDMYGQKEQPVKVTFVLHDKHPSVHGRKEVYSIEQLNILNEEETKLLLETIEAEKEAGIY